MIGMQDSVLDLGQFCADYHTESSAMSFAISLFMSIAKLICIVGIWIIRILAPTMYIFFASALPVIAFGEQLSTATSKTLSSCYFAN